MSLSGVVTRFFFPQATDDWGGGGNMPVGREALTNIGAVGGFRTLEPSSRSLQFCQPSVARLLEWLMAVLPPYKIYSHRYTCEE
jgi:hypothetical protein